MMMLRKNNRWQQLHRRLGLGRRIRCRNFFVHLLSRVNTEAVNKLLDA
jgi:hypothetical protein